MTVTDHDTIWDVRTFVYRQFAATTQPPSLDDVAEHFDLKQDQAELIFQELDRIHAFFLEPGTTHIRIANPFSAVPTDFRVHAQGKSYWANCAWDALGIPAALHSDAVVETSCAESKRPIVLSVQNGELAHSPVVAHFLVPFHRWYEDMVFT